MSPSRATTGRIYRLLKGRVIEGTYRPGAMLNVQRLAREFGASITPLRDVLHQLVGETLIDLHPAGGFQIPILTADVVQQLYEWHHDLIRLALRHGLNRTTPLPRLLDPALVLSAALARDAAQLFEAIGANARNAQHLRAIESVSDRLYHVRLQEPRAMKGVATELESLRSIADTGSIAALRVALSEYHRRRLRRVGRLTALAMSAHS